MASQSTITNATVAICGHQNQLLIQSDSSPTIDYQNGAKQFIVDLPKLLKNIKGVYVNVFQYDPSGGYGSNEDFCKALKAKLNSLSIKSYFDTVSNCSTSALFITAKISVQYGDTVSVIIAFEDGILKTDYEFTQNGYKQIGEDGYSINIKNDGQKNIRDKIYGPNSTSGPKKTILVTDVPGNSMMKFLRAALKSKKLIVFDKHPATISINYINELSKWLFDQTFIKYHILPICKRSFFISTKMDENGAYSFADIEKGAPLPFTQTAHLSNCYDYLYYGYQDDQQNAKKISMERKCHLTRIILSIDAENFIDIKKEVIIYPEIEACLKKLDGNELKKIPVIGMKDDISVIYIYKNGKYQFLDSWNGMYGKNCLITFDGKKPKFCENAISAMSEKPTSGVYGLIKIMSMPSDQVKIEKKQKFTLTKDSENPVLLEFDNFDGTKKAASPAFLMAMLLRQHLKSIQIEMGGEKPLQIGIILFNKFNKDQKERVQKQLKEACELLKIGLFLFMFKFTLFFCILFLCYQWKNL